MIDLNYFQVSKVIMHQIIEKKTHENCSSVIEKDELITITSDVQDTLIERLTEAFNEQSKAFELEIENDSSDSYFQFVKHLENLNEVEFISSSKEIAHLLASKQKRKGIPGGYFILILGKSTLDNHPITIAIKAELHEALRFTDTGLELLREVFLSPSQKLFKIGIFEKLITNSDEEVTKDHFKCYLFDEQFRVQAKPAQYFYYDFLGLTVDKNSKLQTKKFYDVNIDLIRSSQFLDYTDKIELQEALIVEMRSNNQTISTTDFANSNISNLSFKTEYLNEMSELFPNTITKDILLISGSLEKRKMGFSDDINLIGPETSFNNNVEIVDNLDDIRALTISDDYTIIKIQGKPFGL